MEEYTFDHKKLLAGLELLSDKHGRRVGEDNRSDCIAQQSTEPTEFDPDARFFESL